MQANIMKFITSSPGILLHVIITFAMLAVFLLPEPALAQISGAPGFTPPVIGDLSKVPTPDKFWNYFGGEYGDPYSSVFLNQMFGPLFPSESGIQTESIFPHIITYFNVIILLVGGMMFFYNVSVGVMQTAHEGNVLGQRSSSLWAPIRVLVAISLLIPISNGYNMGQAGVAFVVKGSTKMASSVWVRAAELVLDDDIPISTPVTNFDTSILKSLYDHAACMTVIQYQVSNADNNPAIRVQYSASGGTVDDDYQYHYDSAINDGSEWDGDGVCGGWKTPKAPRYIQNIIDDASNSDDLIRKFHDGHRDIMYNITTDMRTITDNLHINEGIITKKVMPQLIPDQIEASHKKATESLSELIKDIRNLATQDERGVQRHRDLLLRRIRGGSEACFSDDGSHEPETSRDATISCHGEGWMGAGAWYILMARINNELSTLTDARSTIYNPTYYTKKINIKGFQITRTNVLNGTSDINFHYSNLPGYREAVEALEKYEDLYNISTIELASRGFQISTDIITDINRESRGASKKDADSFWRNIIPDELMNSGTRFLLDLFDPGRKGDPMVNLISLGHWLITTGAAIMISSASTGFFSGGGAVVALLPIFSILLSTGVTLSYILPIMPFIYWVMGIMGYFLLITEAIVAVNLWALSHLRLDGEGISGEAGKHGWLMILALFMTPTLMVLGFIVGMIAFRVVSDLLSAGMFYAVSSIIGANPISWIFGTLGYVVMIVAIYGLLLERSFSLISEFPNRAMRWIGAGVEIGGDENRIRVAAGAAAIGINNLGNAMESAMGETKGGRFQRMQDPVTGKMRGIGLGGKLMNLGLRGRPNKGVSKEK